MKEEIQFEGPALEPDPSVPPELIFQHPDEVLRDPDLTPAEQRAILASWASDLHAVEGVPEVRQLKNGARVCLKDVLNALQALDGRAPAVIDQVSQIDADIRTNDLSSVNARRARSAIFARG